MALESLSLDPSVWINVSHIAYFEASSGRVGLDPCDWYGSSLVSRLSNLTTNIQRPFVAVADGARIYLGTLLSGASSYIPPGPLITPEDVHRDGFVIEAPHSGTDPRLDQRIVTALTESGKYVP